jgi:hypothetical protein
MIKITKIWHLANEQPEINNKILCERKNGDYETFDLKSKKDLNVFLNLSNPIIRWAYCETIECLDVAIKRAGGEFLRKE